MSEVINQSIFVVVIVGVLLLVLYQGTKRYPVYPSKAKLRRRREHTDYLTRRREGLFVTPGVDVYEEPDYSYDVIDRRRCPMCDEIPLKKCYYCGLYFCEKHRPPKIHRCPNR